MIIIAEIPMPSGGTSGGTSERPMQLQIAVFLLIINALLGLATAGFGIAVYENVESALGLVIALIAFFIAKSLWDGSKDAWTWAVFLNLIAIALYAFSIFWVEGITLCVLTLIYLNVPAVREHLR